MAGIEEFRWDVLVFAGFFFVVPVYIMYEMEARRAAADPHKQQMPYMWGYFLSAYLLCAAVFGPLVMMWRDGQFVSWLTLIILLASLPFALLAVFGLRRSRIAMVLITLISLNPIFYLVNWLYIRNRWDELKRP